MCIAGIITAVCAAAAYEQKHGEKCCGGEISPYVENASVRFSLTHSPSIVPHFSNFVEYFEQFALPIRSDKLRGVSARQH